MHNHRAHGKCVFDYESLQPGRLCSIVSSEADKINTKIRIAEKILFFININKDINIELEVFKFVA